MDQLLYKMNSGPSKLNIFNMSPPKHRDLPSSPTYDYRDVASVSDHGSQSSRGAASEDKENNFTRYRSVSNLTDGNRSAGSYGRRARHRHLVKKSFYEGYKDSLPANIAQKQEQGHNDSHLASYNKDERETAESSSSHKFERSSLARRYNECIMKLKVNSQRHDMIAQELRKVTIEMEGLYSKRDHLLQMMNEIVDERDRLERHIDKLIAKLNKRDLEYRHQSDQETGKEGSENPISNLSDSESSGDEEESTSSTSDNSMRRPSTLHKLTSLVIETARNRSTFFQNDPGACVKTLESQKKSSVKCLDMNGPYDTLVSGSMDGLLHVWDMGKFNSIVSFPGHESSINCLQYDGSHVITGGQDRRINIWNIGSVAEGTFRYVKEPELSLTGHFGGINTLQFDYEGTLVSGAQDGKIKIWDLNSQTCVYTFHTQASAPDLIFSATGPYHDLKRTNAISSVLTSQANISDRNIGLAAPLSKLESETIKGITCLQFFKYALATGGQDGSIRFWDTRVKVSSPLFGGVDRAESPDSFTTVREQSHVNSCKRQLTGHSGAITCLKFDENYMITGGVDRTVRVWDLRMGTVVEGFSSPSPEGICDIQFDSERIIVAAGNSSITVFDRVKRTQRLLNDHESTVRSLKYLGNDLLISGDDYGIIKTWNL